MEEKSERMKVTGGSSNTNERQSNTDQILSNTKPGQLKDFSCTKSGHIRVEWMNEGGGNQQLCSIKGLKGCEPIPSTEITLPVICIKTMYGQ